MYFCTADTPPFRCLPDKPLGRHNGTVKGKLYFRAREMHAIFVRPSALEELPMPGPQQVRRQAR